MGTPQMSANNTEEEPTFLDPSLAKRRARLSRIEKADLPESFRVLLQNNAEHADEEVDAIAAGFARLEKTIEAGNSDRNKQTWVGGAAVFALVLLLLFGVFQLRGIDSAAAVRDTRAIISTVRDAAVPTTTTTTTEEGTTTTTGPKEPPP